jgi:hypothetical protein
MLKFKNFEFSKKQLESVVERLTSNAHRHLRINERRLVFEIVHNSNHRETITIVVPELHASAEKISVLQRRIAEVSQKMSTGSRSSKKTRNNTGQSLQQATRRR